MIHETFWLWLFLVVALIISELVAAKKKLSESLAKQAEVAKRLNVVSQKIAEAGSQEELLRVLANDVAVMLDCDVIILMPEANGCTLGRLQGPSANSLLRIKPLRTGLLAAYCPWDEAPRAYLEQTICSTHCARRGCCRCRRD